MPRTLLDRLSLRPSPPVLPRLTTARTIQAIAQETGEEPSKIAARLDKARRVELGKRARANANPVGSTEFAIRYAVQKLGMASVSSILGIGHDVLYKALNASDAARRLPELGWSRMIALVAELRAKGHTEFFSVAVQAQGDAAAGASAEILPSLHHALSVATLAHGDVARAVVMAADPQAAIQGDITPAQAAIIIDAIARNMEAMTMLQGQVLAAGRTKENAS